MATNQKKQLRSTNSDRFYSFPLHFLAFPFFTTFKFSFTFLIQNRISIFSFSVCFVPSLVFVPVNRCSFTFEYSVFALVRSFVSFLSHFSFAFFWLIFNFFFQQFGFDRIRCPRSSAIYNFPAVFLFSEHQRKRRYLASLLCTRRGFLIEPLALYAFQFSFFTSFYRSFIFFFFVRFFRLFFLTKSTAFNADHDTRSKRTKAFSFLFRHFVLDGNFLWF